MFRPRHAYRSPIIYRYRYRGKMKSLSSPMSSSDELREPQLKVSEQKIKRIKMSPLSPEDFYTEDSLTPTTCTTPNSEQNCRIGLPNSNLVVHAFQAPPLFVNSLKPCNLPTEPEPSVTPPAQTKVMLNCAICGIKDRPPNISKIYGQNSCLLCTRFFATFLKRPKQWYCAQDGDCLMTFDSRCKACWIKICLQKFDMDDEHRKIGQKYSPKLLPYPNVSLITIDTSLSR